MLAVARPRRSVLACILQLQRAFTTIAIGVTFWAILGVSVAVMRLQEWEGAKEGSKPSVSEGIEAITSTKV